MQQHTVQRPRTMNKLLPGRRLDDQVDQFIHHRAIHPHIVARALHIDIGGMPVLPLLIARRVGLADALDGHVVVELTKALDVLVGIHQAYGHINAESFEVVLEGQHHPFKGFLKDQDLEGQGITGFPVHHGAIPDLIAGLP